jgi:hypothetical protein
MMPHTPSRISTHRRPLSAFIDETRAKIPHTDANAPTKIVIETTAGGQNKIKKPMIRAITPSTANAHDSCAKIHCSIPFISFISFFSSSSGIATVHTPCKIRMFAQTNKLSIPIFFTISYGHKLQLLHLSIPVSPLYFCLLPPIYRLREFPACELD